MTISRWDSVRASKRRERGSDDPQHVCHALGCVVAVAPRLLMCRRHWAMVPKHLQRAVWAHYVPGQEISKNPTGEYLEAARAAVAFVAELEESRRRPPEHVQETLL